MSVHDPSTPLSATGPTPRRRRRSRFSNRPSLPPPLTPFQGDLLAKLRADNAAVLLRKSFEEIINATAVVDAVRPEVESLLDEICGKDGDVTDEKQVFQLVRDRMEGGDSVRLWKDGVRDALLQGDMIEGVLDKIEKARREMDENAPDIDVVETEKAEESSEKTPNVPRGGRDRKNTTLGAPATIDSLLKKIQSTGSSVGRTGNAAKGGRPARPSKDVGRKVPIPRRLEVKRAADVALARVPAPGKDEKHSENVVKEGRESHQGSKTNEKAKESEASRVSRDEDGPKSGNGVGVLKGNALENESAGTFENYDQDFISQAKQGSVSSASGKESSRFMPDVARAMVRRDAVIDGDKGSRLAKGGRARNNSVQRMSCLVPEHCKEEDWERTGRSSGKVARGDSGRYPAECEENEAVTKGGKVKKRRDRGAPSDAGAESVPGPDQQPSCDEEKREPRPDRDGRSSVDGVSGDPKDDPATSRGNVASARSGQTEDPVVDLESRKHVHRRARPSSEFKTMKRKARVSRESSEEHSVSGATVEGDSIEKDVKRHPRPSSRGGAKKREPRRLRKRSDLEVGRAGLARSVKTAGFVAAGDGDKKGPPSPESGNSDDDVDALVVGKVVKPTVGEGGLSREQTVEAEDVVESVRDPQCDVDSDGLAIVRAAVEEVRRMPEASLFLEPVNPSSPGCETYFDEIEHPMDLGTILASLSKRARRGRQAPRRYMKVEEAVADVELIWSNCFRFNNDNDDICEDARVCKRRFEELLKTSGCTTQGANSTAVRKSNRSTRGIPPKHRAGESTAATVAAKKRRRPSHKTSVGETSEKRAKKRKSSVPSSEPAVSPSFPEGENLVGRSLAIFTLDVPGLDKIVNEGEEKIRFYKCIVKAYDKVTESYTLYWRLTKLRSSGMQIVDTVQMQLSLGTGEVDDLHMFKLLPSKS